MAGWRGESAAIKALRTTAQTWLDELKDAFFTLDYSQRAVRTAVEAYAEILPDRAGRSGLMPRYRIVDAKAEQHVTDYLALVDKFPATEGLDEQALRTSAYEYGQLAPRLRAMAAELDELQETYSGEFTLVARETRKVEDQRQAAAAAVAEAQRLWEGLRAQGLESPAADTAFAKARVAERGVQAWTATAGLPKLRETVELVNGFVAEVREVVDAYPAQVERARRRAPSLRTRLDAVTTRSEHIPHDLGALRREFSTGNWEDLERRDKVVADLVAQARALVDRLQAAAGREEWNEAVRLLQQAEQAVEAADDAVDAPRERLEALRRIKLDPKARLDKARFALKDAQTMVVRGAVRTTHDIATKLDALAFQLDGLRPLTEGVHPNYWSILTSAERIEHEIAAEVARYRERAR